MSFMDDKIAQRLGGMDFGKKTDVYKFELIKQSKREAAKKFKDLKLIDMGVGEPDKPADPEIVRVLNEESGKPENRFYADNGIPEFREAAAAYLEKVYGVKGIDPHTQIIHGIGTKPILAMLPLCLINPGDITLMTVPGYPVTGTYTKYLGGEVYNLLLKEENGFFPDIKSIPVDVLKRAKLMYLNYPNNPTGRTATADFFKEIVEFAHANNIVIAHDAAYAALTYDGYKPLSFLSIDGAVDIGIEIHSLSKAFNMTGWRMGFIAGNRKLVEAYATVKDNTDSGQFRAIQKAGIYALNNCDITNAICRKYSRRFDLLVRALNETGFSTRKPLGSFYCYVKAPAGTKSGTRFATAQEAAQYLLLNAHISTVPWDDCGPYLRFSVTFEAGSPDEEEKIIAEMKQRLVQLDLVF